MATQLKRHKKKEMLTSTLYSRKKKNKNTTTNRAGEPCTSLEQFGNSFCLTSPRLHADTLSVILFAVQVMTSEINSLLFHFFFLIIDFSANVKSL